MTAISDARDAVLARDGYWCVAITLDPDAGPHYDQWGRPFEGHSATGVQLEVDRVPPEPGSRKARHELHETMVTLCPGHHRGTGPNRGYVWATANRARLRDHLRKMAA